MAVSDLELELDVYEKESPEEWQKIKTFFGNRVEEKLKVRNNQKVPMRKGYLKNLLHPYTMLMILEFCRQF